jgi:hypothetical protein
MRLRDSFTCHHRMSPKLFSPARRSTQIGVRFLRKNQM